LMRISIESLGLTATLLCRLLMKVPQMLSRKCEVEVGYFLGIQALRALLSSVSTPTKRWTVERSVWRQHDLPLNDNQNSRRI
jgi:hypothetical protein